MFPRSLDESHIEFTFDGHELAGLSNKNISKLIEFDNQVANGLCFHIKIQIRSYETFMNFPIRQLQFIT